MDLLRLYFHDLMPQASDDDIEASVLDIFTNDVLYMSFLWSKLTEDESLG